VALAGVGLGPTGRTAAELAPEAEVRPLADRAEEDEVAAEAAAVAVVD